MKKNKLTIWMPVLLLVTGIFVSVSVNSQQQVRQLVDSAKQNPQVKQKVAGLHNEEKGINIDTLKLNDRDKDGIVDSLDKCPDDKGVIEYDGCPIPDSDNDGLADDVDSCPTISGLIKYKGCPTPDSDGDKLNDEDDKCPTVPGVARYSGCPVGDADGDGVNDDDDRCINIAGPAENGGCPFDKKDSKLLLKKIKKGKGKE